MMKPFNDTSIGSIPGASTCTVTLNAPKSVRLAINLSLPPIGSKGIILSSAQGRFLNSPIIFTVIIQAKIFNSNFPSFSITTPI